MSVVLTTLLKVDTHSGVKLCLSADRSHSISKSNGVLTLLCLYCCACSLLKVMKAQIRVTWSEHWVNVCLIDII